MLTYKFIFQFTQYFCFSGVDSLKPLPLPKLSAKQLQSKSIQTFKKWIDSFMEGI